MEDGLVVYLLSEKEMRGLRDLAAEIMYPKVGYNQDQLSMAHKALTGCYAAALEIFLFLDNKLPPENEQE